MLGEFSQVPVPVRSVLPLLSRDGPLFFGGGYEFFSETISVSSSFLGGCIILLTINFFCLETDLQTWLFMMCKLHLCIVGSYN